MHHRAPSVSSDDAPLPLAPEGSTETGAASQGSCSLVLCREDISMLSPCAAGRSIPSEVPAVEPATSHEARTRRSGEDANTDEAAHGSSGDVGVERGAGRPAKGKGKRRSGNESSTSGMYLFHSSHIPTDSATEGLEKDTRRPQRGTKKVSANDGVPSTQHPRQPRGALPPSSHYSLGRLSSSQRSTVPNSTTVTPPSTSLLGEAAPMPGAAAAAAATGPAPVYDHAGSGSELLAALRKWHGHNETPGEQEPRSSRPARAGSARPPVYSGLRPRDDAGPSGPSLDSKRSGLPSPPAGESEHGPALPQTSQPRRSPGERDASVLDVEFSVLSPPQPAAIPYSSDSPNRSALPSQEASLLHLPPPSRHTTVVVEEEGFGTRHVGAALPPLPPPPLTVMAPAAENMEDTKEEVATGNTDPAEEGPTGVAPNEMVDVAAGDHDAVGLTPVLAPHPPQGRYVVLNLLASWGDEYEVGLCGVEFFDDRGVRVLPEAGVERHDTKRTATEKAEGTQKDKGEVGPQQTYSVEQGTVSLGYRTTQPQSSSSPAGGGVHMVAEYTASGEELLALGDATGLEALRTNPRRQLASLVNGRVNTHDEEDMFAMPFTAGQHHLICLVFPRRTTFSMIRLINYCGQGRVHTNKGARIVEITADDTCIFRGEVRQHSGEWLSDPSLAGIQDCENILFTSDHAVLSRIMSSAGVEASEQEPTEEPPRQAAPSRRGVTFVFRSAEDDGGDPSLLSTAGTASARTLPAEAAAGLPMRRPASMDGATPRGPLHGDRHGPPLPVRLRSASPANGAPDERTTGAQGSPVVSPRKDRQAWGAAPPVPATKPALYPTHCPTHVSSACFLVLSTWGDAQRVGLSGLRLRDARGTVVPTTSARWFVQYPDGSHATVEEQEALAASAAPLFVADGPHRCTSTASACAFPFVPAMQLVVVFAEPLPSVGFLEVANYSVGDRTFCGAKEVRLFLSDAPAPAQVGGVARVYRHLWTAGDSGSSRRALQRGCVFEVTPSEGVSLRKAPAHLSAPRFQTYDLSLQAPGPLEAAAEHLVDGAEDDKAFTAARYYISAGPGTGGAKGIAGSFTSASGADPFHRGGLGGGGGGMQYAGAGGTASFANSLNASMNIRAAMAMKRARMTLLRERPEWLLAYQPYTTPLLPVGYVVKVRVLLSARSIGPSPLPSSSQAATAAVSLSGHEVLKAYLRDWVLEPLDACRFLDENGRMVHPIRPGQSPPPPPLTKRGSLSQGGGESSTGARDDADGSEDEDEGGPSYVPMVAECVVTTLPSTAMTASRGAPSPHLSVSLELVYVADTPFCLSALSLCRPLVLDGSAAWVRQVQVRVDDTLVYDSGDAVLAVRRAADKEKRRHRHGSKKRHGKAVENVFSAMVEQQKEKRMTSVEMIQGLGLVRCDTSLRRHIIFSLDTDLLSQLKDSVDAAELVDV